MNFKTGREDELVHLSFVDTKTVKALRGKGRRGCNTLYLSRGFSLAM